MYLIAKMFVENLCSPAVLYLGFALTQIVIDLFRKMYNTAIVKSAVAIVFTTVLNMLCARGLTMVSWFIVFIPFVTMTLVTGILLYVFGLAPFTGKLNYSTNHPDVRCHLTLLLTGELDLNHLWLSKSQLRREVNSPS